MSLRRKKYDKKYRRQKFHVNISARGQNVNYSGQKDHDSGIEDYEEPWEYEPTMFEVLHGRLFHALTKLSIKEAKKLLETWYW